MYLSSKSRFCGLGIVVWFQGWRLIHRIAERVVSDEGLAVLPIVVVGASEQDADAEIDLDQIGGHELAVNDDAGRNIHRATPLGMFLYV